MRRCHPAVAVAAAAVLAVAAGRAPARSARSAYQRLDPYELAERLSAMGMFELLEALTEELDDPAAARRLLARSKITQATTGNMDNARRERLLDEAIGALQALADQTGGARDAKGMMEHFRLTFELVEAGGLIRAKPYALRLMYLQGGRADRRRLIELTSKIVPQLERLNRQVEDALMDWRADLKKLVTVVPELEDLREAIRYKSAWIRFYRAAALADGSEKRRLLNDAIVDAEKFAAGDASSGVKHWSQLLIGMCARELNEHDRAAEALGKANVPQATSGVRVQALFEAARNLIEWGKFAEAVKAVQNFRTEGMELLGRTRELEVDVKSAMLENYLYDSWARAEQKDDPKASGRHLQAAQRVLVDFLAKYDDKPDIKSAFLEVFATKYRDREDYDNLNSTMLLAVATYERRQGTLESLTKAEKLLRIVLERDDDISRSVRPEAILELALMLNARRRNVEAGRLFMQLAGEFPDHRLALQAAKNAVISFNGVIEARRRDRALISRKLRQDFARALEVLLGKWGRREDLAKWNFDLGWQYQKLAGESDYELMSKAVAAYDRVPARLPESMEARYLALELRVKLLDGPAKTRDDPQSLVGMLDRYARDAAEAAEIAKDKSTAQSLREWGALAAFWATKVLYEKLSRKFAALERLKHLPEKWPDTEVLPIIWEFEIGKLVEQEQTAEAIEKVESFRKKYPGKAEALIQLVVRQIRRRIEDLRNDPSKEAELRKYQTAFDRFAGELFASAVKKNLPPDKMYPVEQMRAESLLEGSKPDEALKLFQKCADYDAKRRQAMAEKIDKTFDARIAAVKRAQGNMELTKKAANEYFQLLERYGRRAEDVTEAVNLTKAIEFLDRSNTSRQQEQRLEVVSRTLLEALTALARARKRELPVDARNIRGLARANVALKNYPRAMELYKGLVDGMDKAEHPETYWSVQLERCRCMLEAFRDNRKQLKRLKILIRQLRMEDPQMGGLFGKFNAVQAEADRLSK